ncbi:hypothetical protein LWI29_007561 [Acer saccharum]|uniref:Uncharacterized protein n=1 Tax=Acer saccharum TaxID=4024 RepID=A0AA39VUN9_ACESA|nr:hypothetical protein LWI29_007561 [Acer saccharum]
MEGLRILELSGTAIKELPHRIENHNGLKKLYLRRCNLKEIPEDIFHLSSLVHLDLSGNDFESLPKSMKQLSSLRCLIVNNCNMLQSLTELPLSLTLLSASDCEQLRSIPGTSEFAVKAKFIFTNCPNLEETAVGNILATVEGYEGELDLFSFCCPGSEVPGWFSYKSNESSIEFRMARHDCFNGLLPGFIVYTVIEFEECRFNANDEDGLRVKCCWAFSDGDENDLLADEFSDGDEIDLLNYEFSDYILVAASGIGTLIDSDHLALWYCEPFDHEGTNAVQGIVLDLLNIKDMQLSPQAFKKMYNLRFLKFDVPWYFDGPYNSKVHFPNGLSNLSGKLRSLIWYGFPLTTLPSNFNPKNLVELNLRDSNLERLWEGTMCTPNLKWLDLHGCKRLINIPDLTDAPLLETIELECCQSLLDFPPLAPHLKYLHYLDLQGCESLRSFPSDIHFGSLTSLVLCDCDNLTKFPEISGALRVLDLSGTAIDEVPPSIGSLTKLSKLNLSQCMRLKHISTNICKLKFLHKLNLANCSGLESFPEISEIWETMEGLQFLELSGTAIKELPHSIEHLNGLDELFLRRCKNLEELPSSICNLTSLRCLYLSDCSKLEILPDNFGNLKSLKELSIDRTAISQLPSTMMHLNELDILSCRGCRGLRFTHSSDFPCSLRKLYLSDCNLKETPEDICHLSSLVYLDLSGNDFESLPKSMKQLSMLRYLEVNNCNMLQSLTELPLSLKLLRAIDCKQLRSILLDASDLVKAKFIFTNCPNLEETAVGNILATVEGYEGELDSFRFCCPGSEVPGWFSYKSNESSIKFRMPWHDCFNGLLPRFILCAVVEFEKYCFDANEDVLYVKCMSRIFSDGDKSYPVTGSNRCILVAASRIGTLIDSDHLALWYCKPLYHRILKREFINCSFEFQLSEDGPNCRVKSCGVRPITKIPNEDDKVKYAEPIKIFGVTIEDIGETSRKRSHTSNDHQEEEVEPHSKRLSLDLFH